MVAFQGGKALSIKPEATKPAQGGLQSRIFRRQLGFGYFKSSAVGRRFYNGRIAPVIFLLFSGRCHDATASMPTRLLRSSPLVLPSLIAHWSALAPAS